MSVALQAIQILWPVVEALIVAIQRKEVDTFVTTIPSPLRSRVALNARKVLGY
jgi:hypothetical protein